MILKPVGLMSSPVGPSLSIDLAIIGSDGLVLGDFDHSSSESDVLDWFTYYSGTPNQKDDAGAHMPAAATMASSSGTFVNYADQTWSPDFTWDDGTPTASATNGTAFRFDTLGGWIKFSGIAITGLIGKLDVIGFVTRHCGVLDVTLKDAAGTTIATASKNIPSSSLGTIYKAAVNFSGAATMDVLLTWAACTGGYTGGSGRLYIQHLILRDAS